MTGNRGKKYEGFGTEKTAAEWANAGGLPRNSVCRYLAAGWTVEEIFQYRRVKYDPQAEKTERMKRVGPCMEETIRLIMNLLNDSGYKPSEGAIKVSVLPNSVHHISYRNKYLGWYEYKKDALHLKDGNSLMLRNPLVDKPKITLTQNGEWWLSVETKREIIRHMEQTARQKAVAKG